MPPIVGSIPVKQMVAGGKSVIAQVTDLLAEQDHDTRPNMSGLGQREGDQGRAAEGVGPILIQPPATQHWTCPWIVADGHGLVVDEELFEDRYRRRVHIRHLQQGPGPVQWNRTGHHNAPVVADEPT